MRKIFLLVAVMATVIGGFSAEVVAGNIINVSNKADKEFGIRFELITQNGSTLLRTKLAPFVRINKDKRRGEMAAGICLQAKLVKLINKTTRTEAEDGYILSFSGSVRAHVKKVGGYIIIDLGKAEVDGRKINFK